MKTADSGSMEERMESVDRIFDPVFGPKKLDVLKWVWVIVFVTGLAFGALGVYVRISEKIHLQGLSSHNLFQVVSLPLLFILPLVISLLIWRLIGSALKENLVSERVAKYSMFLIKLLIFIVYYAFAQFALWT
jgi:hypothetical protein